MIRERMPKTFGRFPLDKTIWDRTPFTETAPNSRSVASAVIQFTVQLRSARPILQEVALLNQITGKPSNPFAPGARGFGNAPGFGQMGAYDPITVHIICKSDNFMVDWSIFNY